jgi:Brp/Blh family beta-carotene 15,15'-monooxygenase
MVLTLGIVHGANDLVILKKHHKNQKRFFHSVVGYLALTGGCILSFFIDSYLSLLLFILLSAYHFGEEHFENHIKGPRFWLYLIYLTYGLLIFLMIFHENIQEVNTIVSDLSGDLFSKQWILYLLIGTLISLILLFVYGFIQKYHLKMNFYKEAFYLVLLYLVFKTTSLILGFAVYFILWHSIPSIIGQTQYISGNVSKKSFLNYFKNASLIWLVSIGGLIFLYLYLDQSLFSSVIFLILFAVTAPHAWVMYRMKKD